MKKINIIILSLFVSLAYTEETKKDFQINKLHVGPNEDAYVASFKASANSFILKEVKIKKPKTRNLKKLRFINDDDEYAIRVFDKNGTEMIAIGIGNPFFATYEHIGYEDRKYMGGPVTSADIEIAIPLEFKPAVFIISKRDSLGKFNDLQEILVP
jgi:hypothetical protein|tara:strand:- start:826 stop:1293 length:468 start_codon:yes stop_codon:yes gene_type:complete